MTKTTSTLYHRREIDVRKCNGLVRATLILNTVRLRRGQGGCSEIGFALLQHLSAHFKLLMALSDSVGMLSVHNFGLPAFGRFPLFSAIA